MTYKMNNLIILNTFEIVPMLYTTGELWRHELHIVFAYKIQRATPRAKGWQIDMGQETD